VSAVRQDPESLRGFSRTPQVLAREGCGCQKTFTSVLTAQNGSAYIPPIDAVADAAGAKNLLGSWAGEPDLGREAKLVLWRLLSSDGRSNRFRKNCESGLTSEGDDLKSGSSRSWPTNGGFEISLTGERLKPVMPG
jgi:hypothetical protein